MNSHEKTDLLRNQTLKKSSGVTKKLAHMMNFWFFERISCFAGLQQILLMDFYHMSIF